MVNLHIQSITSKKYKKNVCMEFLIDLSKLSKYNELLYRKLKLLLKLKNKRNLTPDEKYILQALNNDKTVRKVMYESN